MSPTDALIELLERLAVVSDGRVYVTDSELSEWRSDAVKALKNQKLLARARPAKSVVCPGCERACAMPVHTPNHPSGTVAPFVVCDKRDDINRVPVPADLLQQWRCDFEAVCGFIAASLDIRRSNQQSGNGSLKIIGMARCDERRQMLCLRVDGQVTVVAGNKSERLAELIEFSNGKFAIDACAIRELVDSASTADSTYTPAIDRREERKLETQAMYEDWRKAYRELRKQPPQKTDVWYSLRIAKMDIGCGKSSETVRKHMKK